MNEFLSIYLADHAAMLSAELQLIERSRQANQSEDPELASRLAKVHDEVKAQSVRIESLMDHHEVSRDPLKDMGGWMLEKLGRLKLNGRLTEYSPLSRVLELESLMATAHTRSALWRTLQQARLQPSGTPAFDELEQQSRRQADELAEAHQQAISHMLQQPAS